MIILGVGYFIGGSNIGLLEEARVSPDILEDHPLLWSNLQQGGGSRISVDAGKVCTLTLLIRSIPVKNASDLLWGGALHNKTSKI